MEADRPRNDGGRSLRQVGVKPLALEASTRSSAARVGCPWFVDEVDGQHGMRLGRDAVRVAGR